MSTTIANFGSHAGTAERSSPAWQATWPSVISGWPSELLHCGGLRMGSLGERERKRQ